MPQLVRCSLCNSDDYDLISKRAGSKTGRKTDTPTVICKRCGLLYNNPMPSDEELQHYYNEDYTEYVHGRRGYDLLLEQFKDKNERKKETSGMVFNFIREYLKDNNRVLEIGSSAGTLLKTIKDNTNCSVHGLEPNKDIIRISKEYNNVHDVENIFFEDYITKSNQQFDFVIMQHVFEHVRDPNLWLKSINGMLKSNGFMYIALPIASDFKPSRNLEDSLEFGHVYHYTPCTLYHLLLKHNFKIVKWTFDYALSYQLVATRIDNLINCRPYSEFQDGSDVSRLKKKLQLQGTRFLLFRFKRKIKHVISKILPKNI